MGDNLFRGLGVHARASGWTKLIAPQEFSAGAALVKCKAVLPTRKNAPRLVPGGV